LGLRSLEADVVLREQLAQALSADPDRMALVLGDVVDELADAPAGEGLPERLGAGLGRLDDEDLAVSRDPAGTATRPRGVQAHHPHLVEAVDHLSHPIG
jgi:hypothetical protein